MALSLNRCKTALRGRRIGEIFREHCGPQERPASVHSVFDRVVNLCANGELVSLTTGDAGGSARFLDVAAASFRGFGLLPGMPCLLTEETVVAGPLTVLLPDRLPVWRGPLRRGLRAELSAETALHFLALAERLAPAAGQHTGREPGLAALLGHPSRAREAVGGLVGLGPGLTPAGDDILLGFMAVYNHLGDEAAAAKLRRAVSENLHRTTDISAQALLDAAAFEYHEFIQGIVAALCARDADSLTRWLPRLLTIGASSGADMAAGMKAAVAAIANRR